MPLTRDAGRLWYANNPGYPELPVRIFQFLIPADSKIETILIDSATAKELEGEYNVYPVQIPEGYTEETGFTEQDTDVYASVSAYPVEQVRVERYDHYQGNRIVTVRVSPFRYYPPEKRLVFSGNINFTLNTGPGDKAKNAPRLKDPISYNLYFKSLQTLVDNPHDVFMYAVRPECMNPVFEQTGLSVKPATTPAFYNYVVITPDGFSTYFDPFVKWLKRKGMSAGIVSPSDIYSTYSGDGDDGELTDDAGKIRGYLKDGYANHGLSWALLGGTDECKSSLS